MTERPLVSYEPNPLLAWLYHRFFEHIEVDEEWSRAVRDADARGTVVYALRNLSFVDFLALDYLTKRLSLPQVRFANDLGLWILEPMGRGWLQALTPRADQDDAEDLKRAVRAGSSAALFLKRPPHLLEARARGGKIEGDPYIRALFEVQREMKDEPILLVPQVFVWSRRPDRTKHDVVDAVLGPREWPGKIRTVAQFFANYRHVTLRAGEPVDLRAFLASEGGTNGHTVGDDVLVRRLTYTLLRRLERERRSVVGPAQKPADRLREEVIRSPKLQKIIHDMAGEGAAERTVITARALSMLREMEAAPDMAAVEALAAPFEQITSRMYSGTEVDEAGLQRLREASKDGTLILLPSHKSHVDYMVLTHLFLRNHLQLPLIAAGDNLNFFPTGPLFRRAGAFFIRRSFHGDRLYGAVVDAYVRRLLKDGWALEFFLEGGRSRTGKLLSPKLGLLSIVVDAALGVTGRKVYFCPISIGYERFVEEKAFVHEVSGGEKQKEDVKGLLASAGLIAGRYGRLNVQFGELMTLDGVLRELMPDSGPGALTKMTPAKRRALVTRLAHRVLHEINRVTAVTPGALVATALLTHERRGLPHAEMIAVCTQLARTLHAFGARFTPSLAHPTEAGAIRIEALREACELFVRAGHIEVHRPGEPAARAARPGPDAIYVVPDQARLSLDLSKNILVHFFVPRALVATSLLAREAAATPMDVDGLRERVRALSRLFKYEFSFRADATFEQIFDETLAEMLADGEVLRDERGVRPAEGDAYASLALHAQIVKNFVEGYRVAARALATLLKGAATIKDVTKRALQAGERMFLAGEIERREAISRPVLENALAAFVDQGYVSRSDGKLSLAPSYDTAATVRTVEGKIAAFVVPRALA